MFGKASTKKKETKVNLEDDAILANILNEINPQGSSANGSAMAASPSTSAGKSGNSSISNSKLKEKTEMALVKDYIANISKVVSTRKPNVKSEADDDVSKFALFFF